MVENGEDQFQSPDCFCTLEGIHSSHNYCTFHCSDGFHFLIPQYAPNYDKLAIFTAKMADLDKFLQFSDWDQSPGGT